MAPLAFVDQHQPCAAGHERDDQDGGEEEPGMPIEAEEPVGDERPARAGASGLLEPLFDAVITRWLLA
jgi:hypothetical protein